MRRRTSRLGCVLAILWLCRGAIAAAEPATMPYRGLCESIGITFRGDMPQWPEQLPFTIRSEAPGVKPADIRITLRAGAESIPIPVSEDGRFNLPLNRTWFEADALLVSDQPQGTLRMSCEFQAKLTSEEIQFVAVSPHLDCGRISYAALERLAHKSRLQMVERGLEKQFGRDVAWRLKAAGTLAEIEKPAEDPVILLFVEEGREAATVTVAPPGNPLRRFAGRWAAAIGKKQDDVVRTVGQGMFAVHAPKDGTETNPVLTLSDNATWQCMLVDREADDLGWLESARPVRPADAGSGRDP